MFDSFRPVASRSAKNGHNFADLVHLRCAKKDGPSQIHLCHNAANRPDINGCGVGGEPKEHFRGSIPPCGYVLSEGRFASDFPGDTEIDEFDGQVGSHEEILGFKISMEEALPMDVENGFDQLLGDMSDFPFSKSLTSFFSFCGKFVEILFDILEDEVSFIYNTDDLFHPDDVGVIHFAEGFDFSQLEALLPGAILLFKSLYGHDFLGLLIFGHFNVTEGASP